ncbi:MAG: hypothetical protein M3335_08615, partial [Actinomycetota bacterium]|nr:hypothetical protein [Actinomycetota bacterium]
AQDEQDGDAAAAEPRPAAAEHPTEAAARAAGSAAAEGLSLDPVYTAKAMAGLLALRAEGRLAHPVLFVHTDGPR